MTRLPRYAATHSSAPRRMADAAMLRAEPALFGPVASDPVISRLVTRLACAARTEGDPLCPGAGPAAGLGAGRGAAPGAGGGLIPVDIDATIVTACSEQEGLAHVEENLWLPSLDRLR